MSIGYYRRMIHAIGKNRTVAFAAEELQRYLALATGAQHKIKTHTAHEKQDGLWVGTADAFVGVDFSVPDERMDDAIHVEVSGVNGIIAGINPRSVLLAVYRYLTALGCRWVRPGSDGEYVPKVRLDSQSVSIHETASYRHRAICIEGAVSYDHLKNIIDWAPKVAFNGYFIQFTEGYTFFDRWYSAETGDGKLGSLPLAKAQEFVRLAVEEMEKRDLLFHKVGHGWTCAPFGIESIGWEYPPPNVPDTVTPYLAEVNGVRELWKGVPLNTNLCYSNPEVRTTICTAMTDYAQTHPEVDILHFWLADGTNNHCECSECRKARPADFYVAMLNELDNMLTEAKLITKIAFLIYVDLLWPPESERIQNPDRFILMFAPITRTFSKAFAASGSSSPIPEYSRNKLAFPKNVDENIAFLRQWQECFRGDSFDFDYHFMWAHFADPGYTQIAEVLHKDLRNLSAIGLNGFVTCQTQRTFLPTGLGMAVMGKTLWDRNQDYDSLVADYYSAAFGPEGSKVHAYLTKLSEMFDPPYIRGEKPALDAVAAESFRKIPDFLRSFAHTIEQNMKIAEQAWAASWSYLKAHAAIVEPLARALEARALGDSRAVTERWNLVEQVVRSLREQIQPTFDVWLFTKTVKGFLLGTRSA